jgi:MYXO-CTERM domain-containing protein
VVSGLSGTKLALSVTGGIRHTPLTQVRPGLWRFAVAAPRGSGGTTLKVDVLYDGVSLGARELPIGSDVWMATRKPHATSAACTCGAAGSGGGHAPGLLAGGLAAAAIITRRRRRFG